MAYTPCKRRSGRLPLSRFDQGEGYKEPLDRLQGEGYKLRCQFVAYRQQEPRVTPGFTLLDQTNQPRYYVFHIALNIMFHPPSVSRRTSSSRVWEH